MAYAQLQMSKPLTIGYALQDSPVGLLAYIGEKFWAWSGGASGADVDTNIGDLIDNVAIYFLTRSFASSVLLYKQSWPVTRSMVEEHEKWKVAAGTKLAYGNFVSA